jgi:hypothetical protein
MKTLLAYALICIVALVAGCTTYKVMPAPTVTHVTPVVATVPAGTVTTTTYE